MSEAVRMQAAVRLNRSARISSTPEGRKRGSTVRRNLRRPDIY
jgi:hypothetical protein